MRTSPPRHPGIELSGSIRVSMERVRAGVGPYIQGRQTMRPSRPPIMRLVGKGHGRRVWSGVLYKLSSMLAG